MAYAGAARAAGRAGAKASLESMKRLLRVHALPCPADGAAAKKAAAAKAAREKAKEEGDDDDDSEDGDGDGGDDDDDNDDNEQGGRRKRRRFRERREKRFFNPPLVQPPPNQLHATIRKRERAAEKIEGETARAEKARAFARRPVFPHVPNGGALRPEAAEWAKADAGGKARRVLEAAAREEVRGSW